MSSKITVFEWINNLDESNLGLNNKIQKKFDKVDSIEAISEYVDLGLPSGIQWRKYNLGSFSDNEIGDFFNYEEVKMINSNNIKIVVPSKENFKELKKYCEIQELSDGLKYTSKINQKSIIFNHTGYIQNNEYKFNPERPCGLWWSLSKSTYKSQLNISLRPPHEPPRKLKDSIPLVFSVFEANGYNYEPNKFCIRPILLPDSLATNESSLGLSKKVTNKYKEKTTEDVIEDMFTVETFKQSLIDFAIKKCKMKQSSIETKEFPDRTEISFDFENSEQIYFVFTNDEYFKDKDKRFLNHFGLFLNDSEEGCQFFAYLKNPPCPEDCELVSSDTFEDTFFMTKVMYRITPETLKSAEITLKGCIDFVRHGNSLNPNK